MFVRMLELSGSTGTLLEEQDVAQALVQDNASPMRIPSCTMMDFDFRRCPKAVVKMRARRKVSLQGTQTVMRDLSFTQHESGLPQPATVPECVSFRYS